jgi:hypothetical protein
MPRTGASHYPREVVLRLSYHVEDLVVSIGQAAARQPADQAQAAVTVRSSRPGPSGQIRAVSRCVMTRPRIRVYS